MNRLFAALLVTLALAHSGAPEPAQPVFFSMLFPQLVLGCKEEQTPGEAQTAMPQAALGEAVLL